MEGHVDGAELAEIEGRAIEMAREAGVILRKYFGARFDVTYKDKERRNPVTVVDTECQALLTDAISRHYPDHGIVGEEDEEESEEVAPDFVWVLDPLDGTNNFVGGLPVFACSIGVLYRGAPVVGALYIPWPGEGDGAVMHARSGGGAFIDGEPLAVYRGPEPEGSRLTALPASFDRGYRLGKSMRRRVGEVRVTGSIAHELAMTAKGVLQYSITTRPRLWDVAGGAALVVEAGGLVMVGRNVGGRWPLAAPRLRWEPLRSFMPDWRSGATTLAELRRWSAPLVVGGPQVARHVAESIRTEAPLRRQLACALRRS